MGLGVSLRSLYPKAFESLPLISRCVCGRLLTAHMCLQTLVPFSPMELQFPLWSLGCLTLYVMLFFNLQHNVCVSSWNRIVCLLLLLRLRFCCYGPEGPFGTDCYSLAGLPLSSIYLSPACFSS